MTSTELLSQFRLDMDDLEVPYLWTDSEIFSYMTQAQEQVCRKTEGIADSRTASVCQVPVVPTDEWYAKSPLILKVRGVTRDDTGRPIDIVNPEHLNDFGLRFDGKTGVLKALVDGLTDGLFRAYPFPSETVNLTLSVFRLPLADITDIDQKLEVEDKHRYALVWWMRHLGYDKQDADTIDLKRSAEYAERFDAYCLKALKEQERARRNVGVTMYGGIGQTQQWSTDDYYNRW